MKQENHQFQFEGAQYAEHLVQVDERVKLRVYSFLPAYESGNPNVIFVGGLSTMMESFKSIVHELTRDFPFYYIETRDHSSSLVSGEVQFDIENCGMDIVRVIEAFGLEDAKYVLIGYSMGATLIADCYRFLKAKPKQMIFLEPTPVFHYPKWSLILMRASIGLKSRPLKPIAKWYIRNFLIDKKADPGMVIISEKALDNADPEKLKKTILAIVDYTAWDKLAAIDCPVLVLAASKDRFHVYNETMKMVSLLKNCHYIDLETNDRSHSSEAAELIREFARYVPDSSVDIKPD